MSLFQPIPNAGSAADTTRPLADRMRPRALAEFVGQAQLLGPGKLLRRIIASDRITSMILWGPPGSGKTTLAEVIARIAKPPIEQVGKRVALVHLDRLNPRAPRR